MKKICDDMFKGSTEKDLKDMCFSYFNFCKHIQELILYGNYDGVFDLMVKFNGEMAYKIASNRMNGKKIKSPVGLTVIIGGKSGK